LRLHFFKLFYFRTTTKVTNSNDELKAFQIALLRRIRTVREQNKVTASSRPLINLGRYGGATIEQVKIESEKFKRIRDPEKRRRIKAKIYLEQVCQARKTVPRSFAKFN